MTLKPCFLRRRRTTCESWNTAIYTRKLGKSITLFADATLRFVTRPWQWRQQLVRVAPEIKVLPKLYLGFGYAFSNQHVIDRPSNHSFEHRPHFQLVFQQNNEKAIHRLRLRTEGRFIQSNSSGSDTDYFTRIRFQYRGAFPRKKNSSQHFVLAEETMLQANGINDFGFNQQRLYIGFRMNKEKTRAWEIAYMNILRVPNNSDIDLTHTLWINLFF
ncbi:MAG TPA: DUF2490 domain-containing protein [Flavobacteriales bacterium]|nr:DUF2490 domain-containing protein [Flavobacteriales bacterium]HRE97095.1 DUF2490 domain-containing protein [Flavobacteriales bacterium]HRJ35292.1 DUF2490 domain-containing protein [Flavobacteriales bacterium]HRJ38335.1 DUF2490 domain-containing protein [Flavobacteriales bacterium]